MFYIELLLLLITVFRLIINSKDDISKLFGEMTFNNEGRKLVNDQNMYYSDNSDNDSSEDDALFDTGN